MANAKDDEFRRNAADAQAWADKAKTEDERAEWLRIAQGWLGMIRNPTEAEAECLAYRGPAPAENHLLDKTR
jgi:hypothetical protein